MKTIFIRQLLLGDMENFTYIVGDKDAGDAFVVDPSALQTEILKELKAEKLALKGILLTHGHYDHVVDVDKAEVPVYLSEAEASWYTPHVKEYVRTVDGQKISLGAFTIACLSTPGHTPGCICLYDAVDGLLFSGDTLFAGYPIATSIAAIASSHLSVRPPWKAPQ